ncbi:MAG: 50S ribosomal protein L25 [Bacteroidales bacterium]|nr:50S ribosomal protein L25 [Bacteroidales bacterium]
MKHFELKGTVRTEFGKKAAKAIKRNNNIPCVVYGVENTVHFTVASADIRNLIFTPEVMFADLDINGTKKISLVKDIQFDPLSDEVTHIDFYEVDPAKAVKVRIPLKLVGNSVGVKAGGKLKHSLKKISLKGMMEDIPNVYQVNIDELKLNESIRIKDLVSDKLSFTDPQNTIIVSVVSARGASSSAEGEEGAEAPAAE